MKNILVLCSCLWITLSGIASAEQLRLVNPPPKNPQPIQIRAVNDIDYLNLNQLAAALGVRSYYRPETGKLALFFDQAILKLAVNSSFCMVDNQVWQLSAKVVARDGQLWAPLTPTLQLIRNQILLDLQYRLESAPRDTTPASLHSSIETRSPTPSPGPAIAILSDGTFEERQNGLTLKINATKRFNETDFAHFFKGDWLYVTIYGATCDPNGFTNVRLASAVDQLEALPFENSLQLGLKLNRRFERAEVAYDERNNQILISLFLPLNRATLKKIEEVKNTWIVDTIVLDAGHGGRDPGTLGRWGYMDEKEIVLDIAQRVGKLLSRRRDIKVVYTRQTDEFVPLWQRTKIANDNGGKLFLSFHVNAMLENSRGSAEGIELYLQNPTVRSKEAIEVAKLENAVIQMETSEDKAKYKNYDNPSHILANMVFQTYLHDSEKFAEILSHNLTQMVPQKNRGVKQANLYVLVGASMPNLLCEFGYNDNKKEAKLLNNPKHRQKIAEAVCRSIIEFKEYCDRTIQ